VAGRLRTLPPTGRSLGSRLSALPTRTATFYSTPEWRLARTECLRRAGHTCAQCGAKRVRLLADHITELRDGGAPLDQTNLRCLCWSCHSTKTAAARLRRSRGQTPRGG
jgi:5-methylcytosine-specific restriction protein A